MTDAMVYVDVALTPDLEAEGYAREVIRRIQDMRKQLDLAVEDNINAEVAVGDKRILALLHTNEMIAMIGDEVRAKVFGFSKDGSAAGHRPVCLREGVGCRRRRDDDRD